MAPSNAPWRRASSGAASTWSGTGCPSCCTASPRCCCTAGPVRPSGGGAEGKRGVGGVCRRAPEGEGFRRGGEGDPRGGRGEGQKKGRGGPAAAPASLRCRAAAAVPAPGAGSGARGATRRGGDAVRAGRGGRGGRVQDAGRRGARLRHGQAVPSRSVPRLLKTFQISTVSALVPTRPALRNVKYV